MQSNMEIFSDRFIVSVIPMASKSRLSFEMSLFILLNLAIVEQSTEQCTIVFEL